MRQLVEEELAELALAGELARRYDRQARRRAAARAGTRGPCASALGRRCAPAAGTSAARWARLDHTFWPVITHSSPSRSALVRSDGEIGAGVGLGEAERPHRLGGKDAGQEAALLLFAADADQRRADDAEPDVVENARRVDARQLLGVDHLLARAGATAAVLARPFRRQPASVVEPALPGAEELVARALRRAAESRRPSSQPSGRLCSSQVRSSRRKAASCGVSASVIMSGSRLTVVSPAVRVGQHERQCQVRGCGGLLPHPPHPRTLRRKTN